MAHTGFLRVAFQKEIKSGPNEGQKFYSFLIVQDPHDEEGGDWYSCFDAWWFGGTAETPSPYDITGYASKEEPAPVVFELETNKKGYTNIVAIRPAEEHWEPPSYSDVPHPQPKAEEPSLVATGVSLESAKDLLIQAQDMLSTALAANKEALKLLGD